MFFGALQPTVASVGLLPMAPNPGLAHVYFRNIPESMVPAFQTPASIPKSGPAA